MVINMNRMSRRRQQIIAAVGLAVVGLLGLQLTTDIDYNIDDGRRQLQQDESSSSNHKTSRRLALNGPSPLSTDVADTSYIIKPVIGHAIKHVWETHTSGVTKLSPPTASASTQPHYLIKDGQPMNVLDGLSTTNWKSNIVLPNVPQYLEIDLGIPEHIDRIQIEFAQKGDLSFELQISMTGEDDDWTTVETRNSFKQLGITFTNGPYGPARYLRYKFNGGYTALGTPSSPLNPNNERYLKEEEDSTKKRRLTEEEKKTTSSTKVVTSRRNHRKLQTNNDYCGTCAGGDILSQYSCTGYYTCLFGEIGPYRECGPGTVFDSSINNCNFDYATPECGCDASSPDSYASLNAPPTTSSPVQSPRFEDDGDLSGATTPPPSPAGSTASAPATPTSGQGDPYYSVNFVNIWREKRVIRSAHQADLELCGYTAESVKNKLIGRNGGSLITLYENAEYFSANLSPAQAASMAADGCAYAVEPNYIVRARGTRTTRRLGGDASEKNLDSQQENEHVSQETLQEVSQEAHQDQRRLGIPEFNLEDDEPGNWGLERISSRGQRNGKYIWVNEGFGVDIYMFDTGIYPDHSDWTGRNATYMTTGPSRLEEHFVCAGDELDYGAADDHGTFMASIAAGKKYGTAKMSTIHPIQVIDPATGEGSLASILCGVEKLIQDGIDYNLAHAPKKIRAVVNLSLGTNGVSDILDKIASDLTDLGYTVVIAAGDNGGNACHYSPNTPRAIRVGAVQDAGIYSGANDKTSTSNYGECIDIWAPGELIEGATNTGEYDTTTMSGTSVAAAFTTGVATMFLGQILTKNTLQSEFADLTKSKMITQGEKNVLGDIGHESVDRILQTTASACQSNSHCDAPMTCLYDGVCGNLADYFWK